MTVFVQNNAARASRDPPCVRTRSMTTGCAASTSLHLAVRRTSQLQNGGRARAARTRSSVTWGTIGARQPVLADRRLLSSLCLIRSSPCVLCCSPCSPAALDDLSHSPAHSTPSHTPSVRSRDRPATTIDPHIARERWESVRAVHFRRSRSRAI